MKEHLSFQVDASIITRLGRELMAKQETALIELVKNGFDADATEVTVAFEGSEPSDALEIRDNGSGMNRAELVNGFMRLASDLKIRAPRSPRYDRQRAGRKGVGRFAAQRLGDRLILTTCTESAQSALRLTVNWLDFERGKPLDQIPVVLEEVPTCRSGTTLRIEIPSDPWSDAQIRRCWRGVSALLQPFPVASVLNNQTADPGFNVRFLRSVPMFQDEIAVANMQTEILDHLHAVIELSVDGKGRARWRMPKNAFGPPRDWTPIHHQQKDSVQPPPYDNLRNVEMKAYYAILRPDLLPNLVFSRVEQVLSRNGGIRLYRNGFRVIPYGEPDDDWLGLNEFGNRRSLLIPIANRNFFGVVDLRDPEGELFEENTSREGLIETPSFLELRDLASSVLIKAALDIASDRGRKPRGGRATPRPPHPSSGLDSIGEAVRATKDAADQAVREGGDRVAAVAQLAAKTVSTFEAERDEVEAVRAQQADEAAMLRFLATLGMTTAEFMHETGRTFEAFRLDFDQVFDVATEVKSDDAEFMKQATRAKAMLDRLDTLTSYLNSLAAARSLRGMRPLSLSKAVERFRDGMSAQAKSQGIELSVEIPAYNPLFTRPMHEAEIASILLNFYTNAMKAMKRSNNVRRIMITADETEPPEPRVRIRFSDTGDGIPEENRERIFDPFFSTRAAPPAGAPDLAYTSGAGLGLWIVSQIVSNAGGEVSVTEASPDYSTCLEVLLPPEED
jgi:signal transduction histidine kinase